MKDRAREPRFVQCTRMRSRFCRTGRAALVGLALILGFLSLATSPAAAAALTATPTPIPWWDDFATFDQTSNLTTVTLQSASVAFNGMADPSWGLYGDIISSNDPMTQAHAAGLKSIGYFETFGTATSYIVQLGSQVNNDYYAAPFSHWSWNYPGYPRPATGTIAWVGPQNWFDCEYFAGSYTRKHPRYGGRAMMYADGVTTATGYNSKYSALGSGDPRNSNVLDASSSKDILGGLDAGGDQPSGVDLSDPNTYRGLVPAYGVYVGNFSFGKDSACPYWIDQEHASALYVADQGLDGMWTDNFSPWDSFGSPSVAIAFGDWSVAGFRAYLRQNFTDAQLTAMGISPAGLSTYDVRAGLRNKLKALGGTDTNLNDGHWGDVSWQSDPLWHAYCIYKRQTGTQALSNYYNTTKAAGALAGKPDFFVAGNDIPFFGLGWPRGDLDMVSTEMSMGWSLGAGSRGITPPPVGHFAPAYKAAREHAKSRFVNVWMYMDGYDQYRQLSGIANVMNYEMLAHHTTPMLFPDTTHDLGNNQANGDFFKFIKNNKASFGGRLPIEDVGIYYSTSSLLWNMTPAGINVDNQPHQMAVWGWGTALEALHYQYRILPEWKLTADALSQLRVLIVANAEVCDPSQVAIIDPWVRAGGLLIVTGGSGNRLGESGNFNTTTTLTLAGLTGVTKTSGSPTTKLVTVGAGKVYYAKNNIGLTYFLPLSGGVVITDPATIMTSRATTLPQIKTALDSVLSGQDQTAMRADPSIPDTVGLTLYKDDQAHRFFIDVNNLNYIQATDGITSSPLVKFAVKLPTWLQHHPQAYIKQTIMTPPGQGTVSANFLAVGDDRTTMTVSPVMYYSSVMLEPLATPVPVQVLAPVGGESFVGGTPITVHWKTDVPTAGTSVQLDLWNTQGLAANLGTGSNASGESIQQVNLPLMPLASDYRVRVTSSIHSGLWAQSAQPFTITGGLIRVEMPQGGEVWPAGSQQWVGWAANPITCGAEVDMQLWRGPREVADLGSSTAPTGVSSFQVPVPSVAPANDYKVRAFSVLNPTYFDESDGFITIQNDHYVFSAADPSGWAYYQ